MFLDLKFSIFLFHAVLFFTLALAVTDTQAAPLKIMIDPGHGGVDSGAVHGKAKESEIALKVSQLLKEKLNHNSEFLADLTRNSDRNISLQDRVKLAEKNHSDLFLSIHLNSNPDLRAKGVELYFQNHLPPDEEIFFLAANENKYETQTEISSDDEPTKKNDIAAIIEDISRSHRMLTSHRLSVDLKKAWELPHQQNVTIRQAPFYVVAKATVPSVLVELGFISNPKEAEKLSSPVYQAEIAEKIYHGLLLYKENLNHGVAVPVSEKN